MLKKVGGAGIHRVTALLLAVSLCASIGAVDAQKGTMLMQPAHESDVATRIEPGDDFFAYANGEWLKAHEIPADKKRWGAFNEIAETTKRQLATVVTDAAKEPAGSSARKVYDFYAAHLDEAAIEAKGIAPLAPLLKSVDRIGDKTAFSRWLGGQLRADVDPLNQGVFVSSHLFGLAVQYGIHGEKNHFPYLLQGGLGLAERDQYLNDSAAAQALRTTYRDYVARMLELAGFDSAMTRAKAVLALETEIAHAHATAKESDNERNADNRWSRNDFAKLAPGMDWAAFFSAAGLQSQKHLVVWQPGAIKGSAVLVSSQSLQTWKDYLRFHIIHRYADVLPRRFADPARAFRAEASGEQIQRTVDEARSQRAIDITNQTLPDAVGRIYVAKYFPAESKAKLKAIVVRVVAAFSQRVETVPWMSVSTKTLALAKLKTMYFGVGYPDKWLDDSQLRIDPRDAIGNRQRASEWNYRNALTKLAQPVDMHDWAVAPQWPGAILNFLQNSYNFSAALLQPPKFDAAASDAANYGAIGAIFGHEMSHFVDTLGAEYDAQGAIHHWWTAQDKKQYDAASQALVDQFASYRPFPDLAVNGKLTLGENVADLAGLASAFDAYRTTLGARVNDKDFVRQQDRQFFIGFARAWRAKISDAGMRTQTLTNDHAPENYRVATVRNIDAWYDAFDVRPGHRLYLEPNDRVRVW